MPRRLESIASKLGRAIGLCAAGSVIMSTLAVVALLHHYGQAEAIENARASAGYIAGELAERLNRSAQITQEIQSLTTSAARSPRPSRSQLTSQLYQILQREPQIQGVWLIAEPNGFDGRDAGYRGAFAASARGEYYPYWYRRPDGRLVQDTTGKRDNVAADRASSFYRMPVEQNRTVVTEPYIWRMGEGVGEWKSMSSIAAPARIGDHLIGVVGVDLYLEEISRQITDRAHSTRAKFVLLSDKGVVVVSNDRRMIRRKLADEPAVAALFSRTAMAGAAGVVGEWAGDRVAVISLPVIFDASQRPWRLVVAEPTTTVLARTWRLVALVVLGGALLTVLAAALGRRMGRALARPVIEMATAMRRMSEGDLAARLPPAQGSAEIRQMGQALDAFRDYAARAAAADEARRKAEEVAQERSAQLRITSANLPLPEFLDLVVEEIIALTSAEGGMVELIEGDELVYRAGAGQLCDVVGLHVPMDNSLSGETIRSRRAQVCTDAETDPRVNRKLARMGEVRSMITAPLLSGDRVLGLIKTSTRTPDAFTEQDAAHLSVVADLVASAIARELAHEAAERANRAKSEFLANMSHEIRTPLNGVLATAEVLARADLSARERELVEIIRSSGDALAGLLSDILDQARIEAGQLHIEAAPFHLGDLVRGVAALWRLRTDERGVRMTVEIAPDLDRGFLGDALRIRQVLTNFVSNAVKFTAEGGVAIEAAPSAEGRIRLLVRDSGVGFDEEQRARIFARFEQADGSITRRFGGTGLGLAISRQLTLLMGGEIDCASIVGQGSAFWVDLPLTPVELAPAAEAEMPLAEQTVRVLIADDHPTNRTVVELMLQQLGADCLSVEDGQAALAAFEAGVFDLVLMDMQMPVMDGLRATQAIRALEARTGRRRTPVLMLTANALPEHVTASEQAGADGHVAKPITGANLFQAIATALSAAGADVKLAAAS